MKALIAAALVVLAVPVPAEETKLGAGVALKEATPIVALVNHPDQYVGRTIRIDGVATAVCEMMGCWMAVAASDQPNGVTVRLKVEEGVIVFPVSAKGKQVSAQGVFEEVKDAEAREAAGEHAKRDPKASKQYQIKATGALIK